MGKRIFDFTLALVLLLLFWPVLLVIAVVVALDSPGPVLYRGVRGGYRGKPFRIVKFRSMVVNAEDIGGGTTRLRDPRITRAGAWLRRHKLDELPQLFNVVMGDMSFVGPRPELLRYTEKYQGREKNILTVRPGITDLASLRFHSLDEWVGAGDADRTYEEQILEEKNALRIQYAETRSFGLDLKILWRTLITVIHRTVGEER